MVGFKDWGWVRCLIPEMFQGLRLEGLGFRAAFHFSLGYVGVRHVGVEGSALNERPFKSKK